MATSILRKRRIFRLLVQLPDSAMTTKPVFPARREMKYGFVSMPVLSGFISGIV